jgi:hypothetical protein
LKQRPSSHEIPAHRPDSSEQAVQPRAGTRARYRAGAASVVRVLSDPKQLRTVFFDVLRGALDSHMRSAPFLHCMRLQIDWMTAMRSFVPLAAPGSAHRERHAAGSGPGSARRAGFVGSSTGIER